MSPVPAVVTAFALSPSAPYTPLVTDPSESSAPVTSQHLLGTGGFLFAVVVLVSVAGYFYRGRGTPNTRTSNPWTSFSNLLSSIRNHGSPVASPGPPDAWTTDPEAGNAQHVSMVYARYFHPISWNVVECHPATSSTPAIRVEDEAAEIPNSDPQPYGMSSFLDVDDDDGTPHCSLEDSEQLSRFKVKRRPPYDTSSQTDVQFSSDVIGATIRPGVFLSVPEESGEDSSDGALPASDSSCSVPDESSAAQLLTPPKTRRYGMVDIAQLAQHLGATVLEEYPDSGPPKIPRRLDPSDTSKTEKADLAVSREHAEQFEFPDDRGITPSSKTDALDSCDGLQKSFADVITVTAAHDGPDLMRRLLDELRDPDLDCSPRALSDDSNSEYDEDEDEESVLNVTPAWRVDFPRRNSLESTSSVARTDSDVSEEGSIYPLTPPSKSLKFSTSQANVVVEKDRPSKLSPTTTWDNSEVQVTSPTSDFPPSFPIKAYIRSRRDTRSLGYGPGVPLVALPGL